jgi:2,3-bisphosphoglycerate-dependent phosphoglycerate mutase
MDGTLILVRHGESEWNAKNVWTGITDIGLTQKGKEEARAAGTRIADLEIDIAFTSALSRAQETLRIMLESIKKRGTYVLRDPALNERDYGVYTGKNKAEIKAQLGEKDFLGLRRGWDYPVPNGESLKQVYARVIPYFEKAILPLVKTGKSVLVVAHGNSLRALMKRLDDVSDSEIANVELSTGDIIVYTIDSEGRVTARQKRVA